MTTRGIKRGRWGETQGCAFLMRQGFAIVDRNYHTTGGEIDIVATKGDDYYFVEVKTRLAGPMANDTAVTHQKIQRLQKAVATYCFRRGVVDKGIILATLMVVVHKPILRVFFRLSVINH